MYVKYIYEKKNSTSSFFFGLSKLDTLYHASFDSHYRPFSPEDYSLSIVVALFLKLLCLKASEKTEQGNFRREIHKSATWAALLASALTSRCNARIQHTKNKGKQRVSCPGPRAYVFMCCRCVAFLCARITLQLLSMGIFPVCSALPTSRPPQSYPALSQLLIRGEDATKMEMEMERQ